MQASAHPVRGRFAPSPTGEMHIGNARTALAAWLAVRAQRGRLVMRIEDLDPPRVVPGAEARIMDDLRWLGLDWDEGPDVGGPFGPYRQSERRDVYEEAVVALERQGRVYGCTCTRRELRGLLSAPHGPGTDGPAYPGTCRARGIRRGVPYASVVHQCSWRFRLPADGMIDFVDALHGPQRQDIGEVVGDFVVQRADGLFTYQLAVVVDDAAMGITDVVRGGDLLLSTPRQIALQRALGYSQPRYAHVPIVTTPSGERLAKRDRPAMVRALRESGMRAESLVGILAHSLGLTETTSPVRASELVDLFTWAHVPPDPWVAPASMV